MAPASSRAFGMFAEPAHQEYSAKLRSALGGDCSCRAVSLSCEVEFQMAPNLPEQCLPLGLINRIFVGFLVVIASLTTKMITSAFCSIALESRNGKDRDACHRPDSGLMATVNSNSFGSKAFAPAPPESQVIICPVRDTIRRHTPSYFVGGLYANYRSRRR